jgi:hypothetical protein
MDLLWGNWRLRLRIGLAERMSSHSQIEEEFDTAGNAQFFKCAEEVILDGVLAEAQLRGDLLICSASCGTLDNFELAHGEGGRVLFSERRGDRNFLESIQQGVRLPLSSPEVALPDVRDAIDELGHGSFAVEDAARATVERFDYFVSCGLIQE